MDIGLLFDLYRILYRIFCVCICLYVPFQISIGFISEISEMSYRRNRRNCRCSTCIIVNLGPNCPPAGLCWDLGLIFSLAAVL